MFPSYVTLLVFFVIRIIIKSLIHFHLINYRGRVVLELPNMKVIDLTYKIFQMNFFALAAQLFEKILAQIRSIMYRREI